MPLILGSPYLKTVRKALILNPQPGEVEQPLEWSEAEQTLFSQAFLLERDIVVSQ